MYWERELRKKITCAVSQHCPQQQSWGGSHSAGAAVELQPLHQLPPARAVPPAPVGQRGPDGGSGIGEDAV